MHASINFISFYTADILKQMNTSVDPCDNFYDFVCGGFAENAVIPQGKNYWSNFGVAGKLRKLEAKNILEAIDDFVPEDSEVLHLIKVFH